MFKTVSLPAEAWAKIVRRLTAEVGADDASSVLAVAITEQTSGAVKVRATGGSVHFKAGKGGDLRGKAPPGFEGAHFGCEDDCAPD